MSTDIESIKSILSVTPARWQSLAQAVPEELLNRAPAPGEWSALECLLHIIEVEQVFQSRLQAFLDGRESFPAFDPDAEGTLAAPQGSPHDIAAEFAKLRWDSLAAIAGLEPEDLSRKSRHQDLGPVTLEEMLNEWPAHDFNHTVQAERALMQPYIKGCGPWKEFFLDHYISDEK